MSSNQTNPFLSAGIIESLSRNLANFLTNTEITKYLAEAQLHDSPGASKWVRMHDAFVQFQNNKRMSNNILTFVQKTINPTRFVNNNSRFEEARTAVNQSLLFVGLELSDTGKFRRVASAQTISEVQKRTDLLRQKLGDRKAHEQVLKFCKAELLENNYFHAVFEATKSVAQRIRDITGLTSDGASLIDSAMGLGQSNQPIMAINSLTTESEISEHKGFANLLKGIFGMFRNTTGHAPRIHWNLDEEDALDCFTMASLAHRKLDKAIVNRQTL